MPALDYLHSVVVKALINDGWTITHQNVRRGFGDQYIYMDILAERSGVLIAVEVKSFIKLSSVEDLRDAFGHYMMYERVLNAADPTRTPYIAIDILPAQTAFRGSIAKAVIAEYKLNLIVVDSSREEIVTWVAQ